MSLPRSNTASAAVPTSRDEQLKMLFARLARPVAHTAASAASSSAPPSLRLPLSSLPDALRCLGLRLMTEDVDDIVAAAAPFAPLSLSHFAHFVAQAQQQGRHNEEADVSEAFNEMAAACNNASATAAAGRSPRGQAGANDIALSDLHRLLTTQGDALSPEEWQRYLRTIGGDSSGTASAATTALISPSKDRRRVRVGEVILLRCRLLLPEMSAAAPATPTTLVAPSAAVSPPPPLRIAFLAPTVAGTGNKTTSQRIAQGLLDSGFAVDCYSSQDNVDIARLQDACKRRRVDLLLGLHAFRAGQFLLPLHIEHSLPLLMILGGTDVNEMVSPGCASRATVVSVLAAACAVVCFTRAMEKRVRDLWTEETQVRRQANQDPLSMPRLCFVPQAVQLPIQLSPSPPPSAALADSATVPASSFAPSAVAASSCPCGQSFCLRRHLGFAASDFLFILPCTLRAVKDPFFAVPAFERWFRRQQQQQQLHEQQGGRKDCPPPLPRSHLVIVGSVCEEDYRPLSIKYHNAHLLPRQIAPNATNEETVDASAEVAVAAVGSSAGSVSSVSSLSTAVFPSASPLTHYTGVSWLPHVSPDDLFCSLLCSSCMLNSSLSEGQSGAILEALALGVPVIARDNEGNRSLIAGENGEAQHGILFETEQECVQAMQRLCREWQPISMHAASTVATALDEVPAAAGASSSRPTVRDLVRQALRHAQLVHSVAAESAAYAALVRECCRDLQ